MAAGALIIGFFAWPLAKPADPFGVVSFIAGNMTRNGAFELAGLAILAGLLAFFVSWPYGQYIGILAVPSGLAVWAIRSGDMAELMRQNPTASQRLALFAQIKWEPFFWLAIVALGFVAAYICPRFLPQNPGPDPDPKSPGPKSNLYINAAIALGISVLLAKFLLMFLAQDIKLPDEKLGSVIVQVTTAQIFFACLISFGIAAFVVKKFLDLDYTCPIMATALVHPAVITVYLKPDVLQQLAERWPAVFYSNAIASILPIQIVAFGTLGSIAGYWLAVRYNYWRTHES